MSRGWSLKLELNKIEGTRADSIVMIKLQTILGLLVVSAISLSAGAVGEDIIIADFESNRYGNWEVTGTAFGNGPARGTLPNQMQVSGFEGKGLVNSYFEGDKTTGTLKSPAFKIERRYINFLVGGGKHPGETCINLLVDGEVCRTATGPNDRPGGSERLEWQIWEVGELIGKSARIQIVDSHTGGWGHINVDHIIQSNEKLVADRERTLMVQKKYLNLPAKNGAVMRRLEVMVEGKVVRWFDIELAEAEPDFWVFMDIRDLKGKEATIKVKSLRKDNKALDLIHQADEIKGAENLYREKYRPQFHFTSRRGWNNDANGLVYYKGEYHLFYQHNPYGWGWGNMHWGHAISNDLVHWTELGDAIFPDELGTIYSGSAVVDVNNTTVFQTGKEKVLVCIYTSAGSHAPKPVPYTQSIAYSNDRGRTWAKYAKNPVLGHLAGANRDPKVIWHKPSKQWIMALYLEGNKFSLFSSPDLKEWTRLSDIDIPGCGECPDIFELAVDGDPQNTKWVIWGANSSYLVGEFDGKNFQPQSKVLKAYAGGNAYAAQTYSDIPAEDGRRIQIAWLRVDMPAMPFNQMMTFPVELTLHSSGEGIRLFSNPVKEIENLHSKKHSWKNVTLKPGENLLADIKGKLFHIRSEFNIGEAKEFGFKIGNVPVEYKVEEKILFSQGHKALLRPQEGKIYLEILIDRTSIEIFGNQGRVYIPTGLILPEDNQILEIFSLERETQINNLEVYELRSTWEKQ